jgi:hypothetical protein
MYLKAELFGAIKQHGSGQAAAFGASEKVKQKRKDLSLHLLSSRRKQLLVLRWK